MGTFILSFYLYETTNACVDPTVCKGSILQKKSGGLGFRSLEFTASPDYLRDPPNKSCNFSEPQFLHWQHQG